MLIGVPKEIKNNEYRVGLTPDAVYELHSAGHQILIEKGAGLGAGLEDAHYENAGAQLVRGPEEIFAQAELIVKVKEPQPEECKRFNKQQILFTFLHLAASKSLTEALMASGVSAIAYETVKDAQGTLPLLAPMSEVAGRMSVQAAARCLEKPVGGRGVLMGGIPGVAPAYVVIIGGGVVGLNAARMAVGMGANVSIMDRSLSRLRYLDDIFQGRVRTLYSTQASIKEQIQRADAVIGAVLIPGAAAPKLLSREDLGLMKKNAVLVDVAIDQGGCFATSKATTHESPTFVVDDILHYCVANIPGAVARSSTFALNNATLPYVKLLADKGIEALNKLPGFAEGLNIQNGQITCAAVAEAFA